MLELLTATEQDLVIKKLIETHQWHTLIKIGYVNYDNIRQYHTNILDYFRRYGTNYDDIKFVSNWFKPFITTRPLDFIVEVCRHINIEEIAREYFDLFKHDNDSLILMATCSNGDQNLDKEALKLLKERGLTKDNIAEFVASYNGFNCFEQELKELLS